jgi:hypothetical protein
MTSESEPGSWAGVPIRERYGAILVLLTIGYLISGHEGRLLLDVASAAIWLGLLLLALWTPGLSARLRALGVAVTMVLVLVAAALVSFGTATSSGVLFLLLALAQALALVAILERIGRHDRVTLQTVLGAVAAYALIGFAMAAVYRGLDSLSDQALFIGIGVPADYTYFSFTTLTTVGFGDITATGQVVRRLVVLEAVLGQVFLVVLIARLVALWGQPLGRSHRR